MDLKKELSVAKQLAFDAGKEVISIYQTEFFVDIKDDDTPVTQADLAANRIILAGLRAAFPEDALLSEESEDDKARLDSKRVWIVDPIDGTKEFVKKTDEFTINIGLVIDGAPVLGVIFAPALDELYFAAKGQGAFLTHKGETRRLEVSDAAHLPDSVIVKSRSHPNGVLAAFLERHQINKTPSVGSSLKGCHVAAAKADVYPRFNPMYEWDICAMQAIAEEAGATMTCLLGKPLVYNQAHPKFDDGFFLSNGPLHQSLLDDHRRHGGGQ